MKKKITYRARILLTHPFETCKILEISQGRAPECANSTIFCRVFISDIYKNTFFSLCILNTTVKKVHLV